MSETGLQIKDAWGRQSFLSVDYRPMVFIAENNIKYQWAGAEYVAFPYHESPSLYGIKPVADGEYVYVGAEEKNDYTASAVYMVTEGVDDKIDWSEDGTVRAATLTPGLYSIITLCDHLQAIMTAAGGTNISVTQAWMYSFVFGHRPSDSTFSLLWNTGTNAAQSCAKIVGHNPASDRTGSVTYYSNLLDKRVITGINDKLDWSENGVVKSATLTAGYYSLSAIAAHIQTLMRAEGDADTTCSVWWGTHVVFANSTLTTFSLLWKTGANHSRTVGRLLQFDTDFDGTGKLQYIANGSYSVSYGGAVRVSEVAYPECLGVHIRQYYPYYRRNHFGGSGHTIEAVYCDFSFVVDGDRYTSNVTGGLVLGDVEVLCKDAGRAFTSITSSVYPITFTYSQTTNKVTVACPSATTFELSPDPLHTHFLPNYNIQEVLKQLGFDPQKTYSGALSYEADFEFGKTNNYDDYLRVYDENGDTIFSGQSGLMLLDSIHEVSLDNDPADYVNITHSTQDPYYVMIGGGTLSSGGTSYVMSIKKLDSYHARIGWKSVGSAGYSTVNYSPIKILVIKP